MKKNNPKYKKAIRVLLIAGFGLLVGVLSYAAPGALPQSILKDTVFPAHKRNIRNFWKNVRQELSAIPLNTKITKVAEPMPYRKYSIELTSLDSVRICAFLSLPVQGETVHAKPLPAIITTCGYGGSQQGVMLSECQRGYAIIQVYPRGQGESAKFYKIKRDKLTDHLQSPEKNYYRGAYADMMRVIDYLITRNDIDGNRIALAGTSQGGIALAVGALDSRVKAVVAHVPFLCNFRLAAKTPHSLAKNLLDKAGKNNRAALAVLDYFDPFVLASKLKVPVLMSAGGKDKTCPQSTIESVYERLPGKKGIEIYPQLPHTSCMKFYNLSWSWLDQNFRENINY